MMTESPASRHEAAQSPGSLMTQSSPPSHQDTDQSPEMSPCWLSAGACAVLLCGVAAAYSDLEPAPDLADVWYQENNEVHAAAPQQEPGGWAPLLERLLAASAHEEQGYRSVEGEGEREINV
ncbi:hypothetical protein JYU34_006178 [Plutella xylostella]|uniref:Uncharacterized protein n=1 Tax=Plutella xylostella TaxID=51655 RepID=A0ABQ7QV54_PLUXY|nr:hypothetical protein JYU34_006178 [Plutella xylostella]